MNNAENAEKKNPQKALKNSTEMDVEAINKVTEKAIGLAIKIHKKLGPGYTEKIYERAFAHELQKTNMEFVNQCPIEVHYDSLKMGKQVLDFIIENEIIIEIKSALKIIPIHESQLISYLKATNKRIGLILNFGRKKLEIKRKVNGL